MPRSNLAGMVAISKYLRFVSRHSQAQQQHWCGGVGPVADLEDKLRKHYGIKHALSVSNATMGLLALCLAADIREQDFVTTPLTYGATIAGWLMLKNRPVFADLNPSTLNLDSESVRQSLTPKTKAILAVDMFGVPADMTALRSIANEYGIWYFADASQSLGATIRDLPASSLADAFVVSFTAGKSVFAGEGGAILTNNTDLYQKLVWLTQHPARQRRELAIGIDNEFALNARISPLSAALAFATFDSSMKSLRKHQRESFRVINFLNATGLTVPIEFEAERIVPTFYRLTAGWIRKVSEKALSLKLRKAGFLFLPGPFPARLLYQQLSFAKQYRNALPDHGACPNAERVVRRRFELVPSTGPHPTITSLRRD